MSVSMVRMVVNTVHDSGISHTRALVSCLTGGLTQMAAVRGEQMVAIGSLIHAALDVTFW